mmetsp:Transcript_5016/g.9560  ORF Transcript_5016/g.9560 Transcript_5016/m.9560 type:complete len:428 (+) Transcript_5016:235-1518(+)
MPTCAFLVRSREDARKNKRFHFRFLSIRLVSFIPSFPSFLSVILPGILTPQQKKMGSIHENDVRQTCTNASENIAGRECKLPVHGHHDSQRSPWKDVGKEDRQPFDTKKENAAKCRDFRLFRKWVDEASGALSVYCSYSTPDVENFDRAKHAFVVEVKFDFNQKNFRPAKDAEIVEVGPGTNSAFDTNDNQNGDVVTAKIRYREFELETPVFLGANVRHNVRDDGFVGAYLEKYGALDLQHKMFNSIHLESSVFCKWVNLEQENRHKSYRHLLSNEDFVQFMIHAYHLPCCRPRYTPENCVLAVNVSFSFALGQVDRPHNFFILPRDQAFEKLGNWYHLTPKAIKSVEKQCMVKTGERSVDMAVILLAHVSRKLSVHHVKVSRWKILCKKKLDPLTCDRKAMTLFEQVQAKPKLEVDSPDLNESGRR